MELSFLQEEFVDLVLGESFCDVKGLKGGRGTQKAPTAWLADVERLRNDCNLRYQEEEEDEFSLTYGKTVLRVTVMRDVASGSVFFIRKSSARIRPLQEIGFPPQIMQQLLSADTTGLVLVAGEMGAGKTSTAASILVERVSRQGGLGIALEDPPETASNGPHGPGRIVQVPVSRRKGGYAEMLVRAVRSGADALLIGEIREEAAAIEAVRASNNGHFVLTTIHAGSIVQALERLYGFASSVPDVSGMMAEGLSMVIWQAFDKTGTRTDVKRLRASFLGVAGMHAVKTRIAKREFSGIGQEVENQRRAMAWGRSEGSQG